MQLQPTTIPGVHIVRPKRIVDERGFFARVWCPNEFEEFGLSVRVAQINVALSHQRGTLRGMHFQTAPRAEAKLVRCLRGALFDIAVDLRADSPTRGQWFGVELTADNGLMLYIPEGCAHGYQTLADDTELTYQSSEFYSAAHSDGVRFDDPRFAIDWPLDVTCISARDRTWPDWNDSDYDPTRNAVDLAAEHAE